MNAQFLLQPVRHILAEEATHHADNFQDSAPKKKEKEPLGIGFAIVDGVAEYYMHIIVCNCQNEEYVSDCLPPDFCIGAGD